MISVTRLEENLDSVASQYPVHSTIWRPDRDWLIAGFEKLEGDRYGMCKVIDIDDGYYSLHNSSVSC
ncbi:hypothetical protein TSAR_008490 [Trichomalopsis sarcophagae]|uniref:Uncharacterized protein n=1 Tax=Trichomalopsis sarcophagae TaxID=543379 RepID=A0A232EJJ9_9HYME|nr:hypothetical protein TSAR_008490 [Trichomalopsis sarcophagae]